jgi:Lrp/AsnC family transcriptional regulator for asnA, asnC and gidA
MDNFDKEILKLLQENYRISYQELSRKIGKAASTIHNRVQGMLNEGIIKEFDTIIDPFKVGFEAIAVLGISVDPLRIHEVAKEIASFEQVQLVATSTGDHDLIVRIIEKDEKSLWRFIKNKIKTIEGVKPEMDVSSFIDIYKMTHKIEF